MVERNDGVGPFPIVESCGPRAAEQSMSSWAASRKYEASIHLEDLSKAPSDIV